MMDKLKQQKIIEIEELALFTKLEDELKKGRWIGYNKAAASSATEARIVAITERDFHSLLFTFYLQDLSVDVTVSHDISISQRERKSSRISVGIETGFNELPESHEIYKKIESLLDEGYIDSRMPNTINCLCLIDIPQGMKIDSLFHILDVLDEVNK